MNRPQAETKKGNYLKFEKGREDHCQVSRERQCDFAIDFLVTRR